MRHARACFADAHSRPERSAATPRTGRNINVAGLYPNDGVDGALRTLRFSRFPASRAELERRFRALIKEQHPDRNRRESSEERTRDLIAARTLLQERLKKRVPAIGGAHPLMQRVHTERLDLALPVAHLIRVVRPSAVTDRRGHEVKVADQGYTLLRPFETEWADTRYLVLFSSPGRLALALPEANFGPIGPIRMESGRRDEQGLWITIAGHMHFCPSALL